MKKLLSILPFFILLFSSCKKSKTYGIPHCIRHKLITFKKNAQCSSARVEERVFQSDAAYVFRDGFCNNDSIIPVYNSKCKYLGQLGGSSGNTIINGENFYTNSIFVRVLWEK